MKNIKLNHWYINDNDMSISLMRYYVHLNLYIGTDKICVIMTIMENNKVVSKLKFTNLEEAVGFTENVIANAKDVKEIIDGFDRRPMAKLLKK